MLGLLMILHCITVQLESRKVTADFASPKYYFTSDKLNFANHNKCFSHLACTVFDYSVSIIYLALYKTCVLSRHSHSTVPRGVWIVHTIAWLDITFLILILYRYYYILIHFIIYKFYIYYCLIIKPMNIIRSPLLY